MARQLQFEQCDWRGLGGQYALAAEAGTDIEAMGFLAACQRLTGQRRPFDRTVQAIRAWARTPAASDKAWFAAEALLLRLEAESA